MLPCRVGRGRTRVAAEVGRWGIRGGGLLSPLFRGGRVVLAAAGYGCDGHCEHEAYGQDTGSLRVLVCVITNGKNPLASR